MTDPVPLPPSQNPVATPEVTMLSVYTAICLGAAALIVLEAWPDPWVATALPPLLVGLLVFRRAIQAARRVQAEWLAEDDE